MCAGRRARSTVPHLRDLVLGGDLLSILADLQPQLAEPAHVNIRHEHERKERDDVAAPVVQPQVITRHEEKHERDVVAETVLARKQIKELFPEYTPAFIAAFNASMSQPRSFPSLPAFLKGEFTAR